MKYKQSTIVQDGLNKLINYCESFKNKNKRKQISSTWSSVAGFLVTRQLSELAGEAADGAKWYDCDWVAANSSILLLTASISFWKYRFSCMEMFFLCVCYVIKVNLPIAHTHTHSCTTQTHTPHIDTVPCTTYHNSTSWDHLPTWNAGMWCSVPEASGSWWRTNMNSFCRLWICRGYTDAYY